MSKPKKKVSAEHPDALFGRVVSILEQAQGNVVRAVNTNMVLAYWLIGREIVQELQGGEERAAYGKKVVEDMSVRLTERYGKGFSLPNIKRFRQFYQVFSDRGIGSPLGSQFEIEKDPRRGAISENGRSEVDEFPLIPIAHPPGVECINGFSPHLSWSHYRALMRVENGAARDFYEREAA